MLKELICSLYLELYTYTRIHIKLSGTEMKAVFTRQRLNGVDINHITTYDVRMNTWIFGRYHYLKPNTSNRFDHVTGITGSFSNAVCY